MTWPMIARYATFGLIPSRLNLQQFYVLNAAHISKITVVKCQHGINADVYIIEDCTKYGIHKTLGMMAGFGLLNRVVVRRQSIGVIVKKLSAGRAHNTLKAGNRLSLSHEPGIDSFVQGRPRHHESKDIKPFLFFTSILVALVPGVEKRKKEA